MPSAPLKVARCRYFDEHGRPLNPACNMGDRCRFVHPHEVRWATAIAPRPQGTTSNNKLRPYKNKSNQHGRGKSFAPLSTSPNGRAPYAMPLVPQADLFRFCKDEDDDTTMLPLRPMARCEDSERLRGRSMSFSIRSSRERSVRNPDKDEALEHTDFQSNMAEQNRVPRRRLSFAKPPGVEMSGDVSSQELDPSSSGLVFRKAIDAIATEATIPPNKTPPFEDSIWVQKLVALFKRLARLSDDVIQDTSEQAREEKKWHDFTELSATLSKVSPSAAKVISQTLTTVASRQTEAKERLDHDFKALGYLWEDVFDLFVAEITRVIRTELQTAIESLTSAGQNAVDAVSSTCNVPSKRKISNASRFGKDSNGDSRSGRSRADCSSMRNALEDGECRDGKRRRVDERSTHEATAPEEPESTEVNVFLQELKEKIERQARSLDFLAQENSRLKNTLQQQRNVSYVPPRLSCSSSFASTQQSTSAHSTHVMPDSEWIGSSRTFDGFAGSRSLSRKEPRPPSRRGHGDARQSCPRRVG